MDSVQAWQNRLFGNQASPDGCCPTKSFFSLRIMKMTDQREFWAARTGLVLAAVVVLSSPVGFWVPFLTKQKWNNLLLGYKKMDLVLREKNLIFCGGAAGGACGRYGIADSVWWQSGLRLPRLKYRL